MIQKFESARRVNAERITTRTREVVRHGCPIAKFIHSPAFA